MTRCENTSASAFYRLFVSRDRMTLVRVWSTGSVEIATRPEPAAAWGPATLLYEEAPHGT